MKRLTQQTRLVILAAYTVVLLAISKAALGSWIPQTSEKGLWFYSGLASLLLGSLLLEPFYSPPSDTIANGVAAIISLLAVNVWHPKHSDFDRLLWIAMVVYAILVILSSALAITFKDSSNEFCAKLAKSSKVFSENTGTPRIMFSVVYLFALVAFHRNVAREYLIIGATWAILVVIRPLELCAYLLKRWREIFRGMATVDQVGKIVGHRYPGIVLVCQQNDSQVPYGDVLVVQADDGKPGFAMALDHIGYADGCWLRALHLPAPPEIRDDLAGLACLEDSLEPMALQVDTESWKAFLGTNPAYRKRENLLGLVAPDSDVSQLRVEIVRTDLDLAEGRLVEVPIGAKTVLYQIINGLTREEILQQKNTRGYVRADARKIGSWNDETGHFEVVKWVPDPNAPVFLADTANATPRMDAVGYFPGTDYPVTIEDMDSLVTHNTAILGILGVGKTYLAIELVERMIAHGIKMICLDLTDQYAQHLQLFYDAAEEENKIAELKGTGPGGKTTYHKNVEEGGSIGAFKEKVQEILEEFLDPGSARQIVMYNPSEFEVWRQDSKPYQGIASMASLSPAHITRIFAESALQILQKQGMSDTARCCLVLEEAHSLIPEFRSLVDAGDKSAVNGTARAILQGRKFGLGCLLVTQRTANVTKSILNQCNTVFALRIFDATGMDFLSNYIGENYAGVLSTLEDRHAIFFGRASSCHDPVLIRLNDRDEFLRVFRNESQA